MMACREKFRDRSRSGYRRRALPDALRQDLETRAQQPFQRLRTRLELGSVQRLPAVTLIEAEAAQAEKRLLDGVAPVRSARSISGRPSRACAYAELLRGLPRAIAEEAFDILSK